MSAQLLEMRDGAGRFVLVALSVWRLSHLIALEDGPYAVIARMRQRLGDRMLGQLADCFACTSIWVAAPATLMTGAKRRPGELVLVWLALSGAACLLERLPKPTVATHMIYRDDGQEAR
jgi:Protein of unknown function (DUF1360)